MKLLAVIIFSSILAFSAKAQEEIPDQVWKVYYDSTQRYWAKDWEKTVVLLNKAEQLALTDLGIYHENYLTIINDLGLAYWKKRDYTNAEKTLLRCLEIKTDLYPFNHPELFLSACNLAAFYAEGKQWTKSKSIYHRFLKQAEVKLTPEIYPQVVDNLLTLIEIHHPDDVGKLI